MAEGDLERDDWETIMIPAQVGGIQTSIRPDAIQNEESPDLKNVWFHKALLKVDTGYKKFLGTVRGDPRRSFNFKLTTGSSSQVLITNSTFYLKVGTQWHFVSNGTSTTLDANEAAGQTILSVTSETGFAAGEYVGITLNDGSQHQTTVASTGVGLITVDDALPSAADSGNAVVEAVLLTGDADNAVSLDVVPANDWLVFTNNKDNVKRYDGTTVEDVPNLPSSGNTKCKIVRVFINHLHLINTTEGGTAHPQRDRWSDTGDPTNWTTGNANFEEMLDTEEGINAAELLGPNMFLYKESSIIRATFVGRGTLLFNFETMVSNEGTITADGVIVREHEQFFVGRRNVYRYRGDFSIEPVGDNIVEKVFGVSGELSPQYKNRMFMVYSTVLDELMLVYPATPATSPDTIARMHMDTLKWVIRKPANTFTGYGLFEATTGLSWLVAPDTWVDYTFAWNSIRAANEVPILQFCGDESDFVYNYDYIQAKDDGTDIDFEYSTKDFTQPNFDLRIDRFELYATGGTILVEYSVDEGNTWTTYGTITGDVMIKAYRLYGDDGQIVANMIRFRISGTGNGFQLGWIKLKYKLESQW